MAEQKHGGRNTHIFIYKEGVERAHWKWCKSFETSKPFPSDILLPSRPCLILPKLFHQLWTKYLNTWGSGNCSHSNHQKNVWNDGSLYFKLAFLWLLMRSDTLLQVNGHLYFIRKGLPNYMPVFHQSISLKDIFGLYILSYRCMGTPNGALRWHFVGSENWNITHSVACILIFLVSKVTHKFFILMKLSFLLKLNAFQITFPTSR